MRHTFCLGLQAGAFHILHLCILHSLLLISVSAFCILHFMFLIVTLHFEGECSEAQVLSLITGRGARGWGISAVGERGGTG